MLGIETAGPVGSLALLLANGEQRLVEFAAAGKLGAELAPTVQRLLKDAGLGPNSPPDLVVVDTGPGSYTGLRIGLAAAKGLAFAWSRPLIGISAPEALSTHADQAHPRVLCAMDASRGEVWAALFQRRPDGRLDLVEPGELYTPAVLAKRLTSPTWVVGDAAQAVADDARGIVVSNEPEWPNALQVAELGRRRFMAGARDEALRMCPTYYRPNEAEEQRRKRSMKEQPSKKKRSSRG
ncbi:MAG: tRNA (adenosine(37)-N6)-threonylcarbamoyltransferase complex dimerization subunit type 1 TsaB [Planctomycetes bacterium]|nr:tRNA (adenosine(37)-N6)-threonylcarbamoyltransferase complex dimerization subunit type 1 TsaB [Planctomycetota bacterium]